MENEQVSETGTEAQAPAAETATSSEEVANATPNESENTQTDATEEDKIEPIQDAEGKKFIPYEAFEKRLGKATARAKEAEELLTALRTDPEVRKQFIKEMEGADSQPEAPATEAPGQEEVTPIATWLQGLGQSPEHQSFYQKYTEAILQTVDTAVTRYVQKEIEARLGKELAPVKHFIGESQINTFKSKATDFPKYQSKVAQLMKDKKLTLDEAYKLAKYDDVQKELSTVRGGKSSQVSQNRDRLKQTPIARHQPLKMAEHEDGSMTLKQAVAESLRIHGWGK